MNAFQVTFVWCVIALAFLGIVIGLVVDGTCVAYFPAMFG